MIHGKSMFLSCALLAFGLTNAQLPIDSTSQKVVYKRIIEVDTAAKAEQLYKSGREWFAANPRVLNASNEENNSDASAMLLGTKKGNQAEIDQLYKNDNPLKSEDAADKRLVGISTLKYTGSKMGCIRVLYLQYTLKLAFKDGKARFEASDFTYNHYNQMSMQKQQMYGWSDKGSCGSTNSLEELPKCDHCDGEKAAFFTFVNQNIDKQVASLKTAMQSSKSEAW